MFFSPGGFVCSTCRAASHGGRGLPLRLQLAGQGGGGDAVVVMMMAIDMMMMVMMM